MIEKMKFVSITGPKADIDRVTNTYITRYDIHLENALGELKSQKGLTPYIQINPYKDKLKLAEDYTALLPAEKKPAESDLSLEEANRVLSELDSRMMELRKKKEDLETTRQSQAELLEKLAPFQTLPCELSTLFSFKIIRFRFGKILKEYYPSFESYIFSNPNTIFDRCYTDSKYIWGIYFTPRESLRKVDAITASMHFERIWLPDAYKGLPEEAYQKLDQSIKELNDQIQKLTQEISAFLASHAADLRGARTRLTAVSANFDIRKLAACTSSKKETFYILCGWMSEEDTAKFQKEVENDPDVFFMVESSIEDVSSIPPTKLKNPKFFQPFEMFIKMYGLPGYNEFDPTMFLAITYCIIFGSMFGDTGHGLLLVIGGFLLYSRKKIPLAAIMGTAGIFSVLFGLLYGSFFGFEEVFPWGALIRPKEAMLTLPIVGKMNTVFVVSIGFGMIMILFTMILGIVNARKQKDKENIYFSQNALAGLIFYGAITVLVFLTMSKKDALLKIILPLLIVLLIISLVIIFLKEMLTRIAEKRTPAIEGGKGMFFVQSFFETFETILSYLSNTLSYVRIGAYAVSHVAMMQVVMQLAGAEAGGHGNLIIIIIGNLFVAAMEGLMAAIQVLRLEYYEMFSRFYKGNGREFRPFNRRKASN